MTVNVLVETEPDGRVRATLLGWPDTAVLGATEAEALARLRQLLATRLAHARIVPLAVDLGAPAHPWLQLAERFRDNPLLDEVTTSIATARRDGDPADPPAS